MNTVQGDSPLRCQHDGHIFDNWFCPESTILDKVAAIAFHIFTACIPLIVYHCAQYVVLLMEYDRSVAEVQESSHLPPNSAIQALFQDRVTAALEESSTCSPMARRLDFSDEDTEGEVTVSPTPLDVEVDRSSSPPEEPGLFAIPSDVSENFVWSEEAFNYLVDLLDDKLIEIESDDEDVELFWEFLTAENLEQVALAILLGEDIQYSEEELLQFIEANLDRAILVLRERSEVRALKRALSIQAVEFTDLSCQEIEPFDWNQLEIGVPEDYFQLISLPARELPDGLDPNEVEDRLLLVRPIPDIVSLGYSLYINKYAELQLLLTPQSNMADLFDQPLLSKAYDLLQVAYTIGLRSFCALLEYNEDSDGNELNKDDHIAILVSNHLPYSRAFLFCGQLYHLIRTRSVYNVEQQQMMQLGDQPPTWAQKFYEEVTQSTQAKIRFLYNQFCQEIFDFFGKEKWEQFCLEHNEYACWYCPDDPAKPYQYPLWELE